MEAYVHGVSTRQVDDLVAALGVDTGISKSEVSRICAGLDEQVAAYDTDHCAFPYVFLDATYCKARLNGRVVSQAVVIATGVSADGRREVLGSRFGDSDSKAFWTEFLRGLRERGLAGVQLVTQRSPPRPDRRSRPGHGRRDLATLPGPLHAQRADPGTQGVLGDGRDHDSHRLRPAHRTPGP